MISLFAFDKRNKIVLHPEALKLTKHLKKVTPEQLHYIVLAYDYSSKNHQFSLEERQKKARQEAFPGTDYSFDVEEVHEPLRLAALEYNDLQFDSLRENRRAIVNKLAMLRKEFMEETKHSVIQSIDKTMNLLEGRLTALDEKIYENDLEEQVLKGDRVRSFIEKWQMNMVERAREREKAELNSGTEWFE